MGSISYCTKSIQNDEQQQNEILISESNQQIQCQQISKNFIKSNPKLIIENKNEPFNQGYQKQIRYFEFDFRKIIQVYLRDSNLDQSLKISDNTNLQEANDLAFEFICHIAILHFCFQQINHNTVRKLLNTQMSQIIYSLLTYTNIKGTNLKIWELFISNWLQQIVNIYESELNYINKSIKNKVEGVESLEKNELIKTLEQFREQQEVPQIKQLIAIDALEYFNKKEAFSFLKEDKAKQIRLSGRVLFK